MEENIIAIYDRNHTLGLKVFNDFMAKTTAYMNDLATKDSSYKACEGQKMERKVFEAMVVCCEDTPIERESIELVSGHKFPDIVAGGHFGVEVKTTKEDKWTSVGSSIIESTRIANIDHIYMMFAKLGGTPVQFQCKPYQDCLFDIAVTHSPRYLIDMEIKKEETIFSKMGVDYDEFRLSGNSINIARQYYLDKALREHKPEMPWWLNQETTVPPTLKLWVKGAFTVEEQSALKAKMLILFGDEICHSNYQTASLWLCTRLGIVNGSIRDTMSAGGKFKDGDNTYPHIVKEIMELKNMVKKIIVSPDFELDLSNYAVTLYNTPLDERYMVWSQMIKNALSQYGDLNKYF